MRKLIDAIDKVLAAPPACPELLGDGIVVTPAFLSQVRAAMAGRPKRREAVIGDR